MTALSPLFDDSIPLREFSLSNINDIPQYGSIIYTVFLDRKEFIYVGIGGLSGKKDPRSRIRQHTQGRRSGDQFCIYVADFLVLPELSIEEIAAIHKREIRMDLLVKQYVHWNLSYRFCLTEDGAQALALEKLIVMGAMGNKPFLNPPKSTKQPLIK